MSDVNAFLNKISSLNNEQLITAKIPSTGETAVFTPVTVKQQKQLLKQTLGGVSSVTDLLVNLNEIILTNCRSTARLMSYDKYPVLVALRKNAFGNNIKLDGKDYDLNSLPLADKVSTTLNGTEFTVDKIKVTIATPSLEEETKFIKKCGTEFKKTGNDDAKEIVTSMYVAEIAKFVKMVEVDGTTLDFGSLNVTDMIKVVENLPVSVNQKVLDFVSSIREYENRFITFDDGASLPIDALFITSE